MGGERGRKRAKGGRVCVKGGGGGGGGNGGGGSMGKDRSKRRSDSLRVTNRERIVESASMREDR